MNLQFTKKKQYVNFTKKKKNQQQKRKIYQEI